MRKTILLAKLSELRNKDQEISELFAQYPKLLSITKIIDTGYPMDINFLREACMLEALGEARKLRRFVDFTGLAKWVSKYEAEIMRHFNHTELQQEFYMYKGIRFLNDRQNRGQAVEYFHKALKLPIENRHRPNLPVRLYKELGSYYRFIESYEQAEKYHQKALELLGDDTSSQLYTELIHNFVSLYADLGKYDLAEKMVTNILEQKKKNGNSYLVDALYLVQARIAIATSNIEASAFYLQKAKTFNEFSGYYGLIPYINAMKLIIRLHKAGIHSHEGELLSDTHRDEIPKIYDFYMSQPDVQKAYLAYENNACQQRAKELKLKYPLAVS